MQNKSPEIENCAQLLTEMKEQLTSKLSKTIDEDYSYILNLEDLKIPTEDYAETDCQDYFQKHERFINEVKTHTFEENKKMIMSFPPSNDLIENVQHNINGVTQHSLDHILMASKSKIISKVNFLDSMHGENIKIATDYIVIPEFQNMLNKKYHPEVIFTSKSASTCYYKMSVYSSISENKMCEFLVSENCSFELLLSSIDCLVCKVDSKKYNRFICLKKVIVYEKDPFKLDLNVDFILNRMKIYHPEFQKMEAVPGLLLKDVEIDLDMVFILRDNLGCDHMTIFTNKMFGELQNYDKSARIIQTFIPKYFVRGCEVCESENAVKIVKNSKISQKSINFLCEQCFKDLHFDGQNNLKIQNFEPIDYCYEER